MKKTILAALVIVAMASCAKENTAVEPIDPTAPVAATFSAAAITRVADNAWVANDQIGITMVETSLFSLATGSYENVPYTVDAKATGTFTPTAVEVGDPETIYFPVDGTEVVDFIAYYPHSTIDSNSNIAISVADQEYAHIDVVAAKAVGKTKSSGTVVFTGDYAFEHKLSKLSMTIVAGDGVASLDGLVTTIKGQKTTAEFNIYTFGISSESDVDEITAITTTTTVDVTSTTTSTAILLPTEAVDGSTIEFAVGGNVYILDTSSIAFTQGKESTYEITLKKTGVEITSSTINVWGEGESDELDATDYVEAVATPTVTQLEISNNEIGGQDGTYSLTVNAVNATKVYLLMSTTEKSGITADDIRDEATITFTSDTFGSTHDNLFYGSYTLYIYAVAEDAAGNLGEISETSATNY